MIDIVSVWYSICVDCGEEFEGSAERCDFCAGAFATQEEIAQLKAEIARLRAELEKREAWEPVPDGEYRYLVGRPLSVKEDGKRIALDFDVYDCSTGDWEAAPHHTYFPDEIRLCRRTQPAKEEDDE